MKYISIYASFLLLSLFGCESFDHPIYINLPKSDPQLVINSLFNPDSLWTVQVSKVQDALEKSGENADDANITNAKVELFENGTLLEVLPHTANGVYRSKINKPQLGKSYKVHVSAADFPDAEATSSLPSMPNTTYISQITRSSPTEQSFRQRKFNAAVTMRWDDPPDVGDGYMLTVFRRKLISFSNSAWTYTTYEEGRFTSTSPYLGKSHDPINELTGEDYFWDAAIFQDELFNGQNTEIKLTLGGYTQFTRLTQGTTIQTDKIKQVVMLAHLSNAMRRYESTTQQQTNYGDTPFTEPTEIYSNIQGGKGIFAGFCAKYFVIE